MMDSLVLGHQIYTTAVVYIYVRALSRFLSRGNTQLRNSPFLSRDGTGTKTLSGETRRSKRGGEGGEPPPPPRLRQCNSVAAVETFNCAQNPSRAFFPPFRLVSSRLVSSRLVSLAGRESHLIPRGIASSYALGLIYFLRR